MLIDTSKSTLPPVEMNGSKLKNVLLKSSGIILVALTQPTIAQVIPDATLPNPSVVNLQGTRSRITQGTEVNGNLFHSFREFSIPTGSSVLFDNAIDIRNIFTRVTGGTVSSIDGLIEANGTANLFLLNPNGILFGANARLNIGGSFAASTGDRFVFDNGEFSATNPEAPPLLTISAPIGLGIPRAGSTIVNRGNLIVPENLTLQAEQLDIEGQLSAGKDLVLRSQTPVIGGAQFYSGGNFRIEASEESLGALSTEKESVIRSLGDVTFNHYSGASLNISAGGSVRLLGGIDTSASDSGNAGNVQLSAKGDIAIADITTTSQLGDAGSVQVRSFEGAIDINGKISAFTDFDGSNGNAVTLEAERDIRVDFIGTMGGTRGGSGDITLHSYSGSIFVDGGSLFSATFGGRDAGAITLKAGQNVEITNSDIISGTSDLSKLFRAGISSGNGGDITIEAGNSIVLNQTALGSLSSIPSALLSNDFGFRELTQVPGGPESRGNAGNIRLKAGQDIIANDSALDSSTGNAGAFRPALFTMPGNAGNIELSAGNAITWRDGGVYRFSYPGLFAYSRGLGNAGDITIDANSLSVFGSFIETGVSFQARGQSGDINIRVRDKMLLDGNGWIAGIFAELRPSGRVVEGFGTKGNIQIQAGSLTLQNGSTITTGVGDTNQDYVAGGRATGNAGNIEIKVDRDLGLSQSFISSRVFGNGTGNAGEINIQADSIDTDRAIITSDITGRGNANTITINANRIRLNNSDISSAVQPNGIGAGRDITLNARSIELVNGAQINTVSSGQGSAGNVQITADQVRIGELNLTRTPSNFLYAWLPDETGSFVIPPFPGAFLFTAAPDFVDGIASGIYSSTNTSSRGGNITVNARSLTIADGGAIDARTTSIGNGGTIDITSNQTRLQSGGQISALTSGSGNGGTILLKSDQVQIAGSDSTYSTRLAQVGDQTDIYGKARIGNQSATSGIFASSSTQSTGNGGTIDITTQNTTLSDGGEVSVNNQGAGDGGRIKITTGDLSLDRGNIVAKTESGEGGNISLTAQNLLRLRRNSQISATANGIGNGGNIDITANGFIVAVPTENSDITANAVRGRGGNIQLTTQAIFGISPSSSPTRLSDITASSEFGLDGTVRLTTLQPETREQVQELPQLVDTSNQIAQTCSPRSRSNSFVVTGKGGLPPDPSEALNAIAVWRNSGESTAISSPESKAIVEATHWIKNADGSIALVSGASVQPTVPVCQGERP